MSETPEPTTTDEAAARSARRKVFWAEIAAGNAAHWEAHRYDPATNRCGGCGKPWPCSDIRAVGPHPDDVQAAAAYNRRAAAVLRSLA